jgi:DNA-directed RNA polymerase sigma subunit (sigma70/sigma32)
MPMTEDIFDLGVRAQLERTVGAGLEVRKQVIESNLRKVVANTRRYTRGHVDMLDLIEEGTSA